MRTSLNTRGVALPVAVFALVIVGAIVAGSFYIGMQEQQVGYNIVKQQQAFAAAEAGVQRAVAQWNSVVLNGLLPGESSNIGGVLADNAGWYRGSVRRLNNELFLVRSEGFSADSSARQHVGMVVRLTPIQVTPSAALATSGATSLQGTARVDGNDIFPPDVTGCTLQPPLPGIRTSSTVENCSRPGGCVFGDPPVFTDPTATEENLSTFGEHDFESLAAMATIYREDNTNTVYQVEPGLTDDGVCDTSIWTNWGEPDLATAYGACRGYFPIIYFKGNLAVNNHRGQGVLIVDGDLSVRGNFRFYGLVLVRGAFEAAQGTPAILGSVIAANSEFNPDNTISGTPTVQYSSCAASRALTNSAVSAPLMTRSWANLY